MSTILELPLDETVKVDVPPDCLWEFLDGEYQEKAMSVDAVYLANIIAELLNDYGRRTNLGRALVEIPILVKEEPRSSRRPDVSFIAYQDWQELTVPTTDSWAVVPQMVAEVVSPSNTGNKLERKVVEYFDAHIPWVWVVYPESQTVYLYDSPDRIRRLANTDVITSTGVLPELSIPVANLFAELHRPTIAAVPPTP